MSRKAVPCTASTSGFLVGCTSTLCKPLLVLLLLGCVASLCATTVQGSPLVPKTDKQELTDSQRLTKVLRDPNSPEAHEHRRRVACRRACWAKYVPEDADCLKDTICYQVSKCWLIFMTEENKRICKF
ncbi:uncharacterized protein LOC128858281 [Anastrepha ludens]|uniref:uncharacterized protein LOC128858281 n=1 Tax=Anastrepha ludens TaxID=28586 RepID=UPI0023B09413|nr:uncharacterized protein LOC128858281 [Anastrepha ludens]